MLDQHFFTLNMEMAKIGYRKIMSWTYPGPILKYTTAHIKICKRTKSGLQMLEMIFTFALLADGAQDFAKRQESIHQNIQSPMGS